MKNAVDLSCRLTLFVSDVVFDLPLTSRTMTPNCEATAMTSGGDAGEPRDVTRSRGHHDDVMAKRRRKIKLAIIGITLLLILFTYLLIYFMPVLTLLLILICVILVAVTLSMSQHIDDMGDYQFQTLYNNIQSAGFWSSSISGKSSPQPSSNHAFLLTGPRHNLALGSRAFRISAPTPGTRSHRNTECPRMFISC